MMKRNQFLKTSLLASVIGFSPFSSLAKTPTIKKNPVIEFTPENLSEFNVGTYIINDKANVENNVGYAITVTWKLVWQMKYIKEVNIANDRKVILPRYGKCNVLTDGWTHWIGEKAQLCDWLNNNPHGDKYRILTPNELLYMITNRSNQKQIARYISKGNDG